MNEALGGEICDFGLALLLRNEAFLPLAMASDFRGAIRWCSPEVLVQEGRERGIEGDVWAWAWLAWEVRNFRDRSVALTSIVSRFSRASSHTMTFPTIQWPCSRLC